MYTQPDGQFEWKDIHPKNKHQSFRESRFLCWTCEYFCTANSDHKATRGELQAETTSKFPYTASSYPPAISWAELWGGEGGGREGGAAVTEQGKSCILIYGHFPPPSLSPQTTVFLRGPRNKQPNQSATSLNNKKKEKRRRSNSRWWWNIIELEIYTEFFVLGQFSNSPLVIFISAPLNPRPGEVSEDTSADPTRGATQREEKQKHF